MVATSLFTGRVPPTCNLKLISQERLILAAIQKVLACQVKKNNLFLGVSFDILLAAGYQATGVKVILNQNVNSIINDNYMRTTRLCRKPSVSIRKKYPLEPRVNLQWLLHDFQWRLL